MWGLVLLAALGANRDFAGKPHQKPDDLVMVKKVGFDGTRNGMPAEGVDLNNPEKELKGLKRPNEIVVTAKRALFVLEYPPEATSMEYEVVAPSPKGFTRRQLAETIVELFAWVRRASEATAETTQPGPLDQSSKKAPKAPKRALTVPRADLHLHDVSVMQTAAGRTYLYFGINL